MARADTAMGGERRNNMPAFTYITIAGVLMILIGISLLATPFMTFISAGYFIIFLFLIWGSVEIIRAIAEKCRDTDFFFAVLSLILGIAGLVVPGAAAMNNYVMLYLAAGWLIMHGMLSVFNAIIGNRKKVGSTGIMILEIIMALLEVIMGIYSAAHPLMLSLSLGALIGFYFIESGINAIINGLTMCPDGNNTMILFTAIGILTIIGGTSILATPLLSFLSVCYCIIILFFINGVLGIVCGFIEKQFDKDFFFAVFSLILGIIGFTVPGIADLNNYILLYMAAGWLFVHGVLTILNAVQRRREGETSVLVIGIILGVLETIMGIYSTAHPTILAISLGLLTGFYFIESGANMIYMGSAYAKAVAVDPR